MIEALTIFCAKYLFILSPLVLAWGLWRLPKDKRKEVIIFGCVVLPLSYIVATIARGLWYDPRPFVLGGFTPLIPHSPDNGFPSDHTLLAAALAATMIYSDKKIAVFMWLIAFVVGVARVLAGVHHFIDILASLLIALGVAFIAHAIISKLWNKHQANS